MFTLDNIAAIHAKTKTGADFPRYVQDLKAIGMSHYDFYLADGHAEYVSVSGQHLHAPAKYPVQDVALKGNTDALRQMISIHQQGLSDFPTICKEAAKAGVQFWRTDVANLQCIYFDLDGNTMVTEPIPDANAYN